MMFDDVYVHLHIESIAYSARYSKHVSLGFSRHWGLAGTYRYMGGRLEEVEGGDGKGPAFDVRSS